MSFLAEHSRLDPLAGYACFMATDLDQLADRASDLLRRVRERPVEERTPLFRELAQTIVEARGHFDTADGRPDWKGSTHPYRVWIRSVYDRALVPRDEFTSMQSTLRYHVSAALRDRLDPETLQEYGLASASSREKSTERHRAQREQLAALTSREIAGGALVALTAAQAVLSKAAPADLAELEWGAATVAEALIADIERRLAVLRKGLPVIPPGESLPPDEPTHRPVTSLEFQPASPPE